MWGRQNVAAVAYPSVCLRSLGPPLTHKQNSGNILAIRREVLVCRFILWSKNKAKHSCSFIL